MNSKAASRNSRVRKMAAFMLIIAYGLLMSAVPAFATADIAGQVTQGLSQVYKIISAIVLPIAIIALAWAASKLIGGGARGGEEAKAMIIKIIIGIGIVYLAPVIITTIAGWFSKGGTSINGVNFGG